MEVIITVVLFTIFSESIMPRKLDSRLKTCNIPIKFLHCHVSCLVFFDFFLVVDEFRAEILFALLSDEALDLHRMEGGL